MPVFVLSFLLFVVVIMMMKGDGPSASSQRPHQPSLVRDGGGMGSKYPVTHTNPQHSSNQAPASTSKAKVYDPSVVPQVKADTVAMRKMLSDYYKSDKPMESTWGYPLNPEGISHVGEKVARAIKHSDKFVIGVIGSSVAAGHDNCNYDSFERQLERMLTPLFARAGVKLEVRNAGEGGSCGDNMENQIFCLRNMVGDDVDVTIYSWTYFEAGWFKSDDSRKGLANIHEMFTRWSLKMDRSPTPMFVNVGEDSKPWDGWNSLVKRYGKYGTNVIYIQKYLNTIGYKRKWNEAGDGMHTTTRYGEHANSTRKKSLGAVFRNWHPGPLGFQLVADTLAWSLTASILKGCELLESGADVSAKVPLMLESALPEHECKATSIGHSPKWCETEEPPSCINYERPTYGNGQIRISTGDELNPWYGTYKEDHREVLKPERELIPREEREAAECKHLDVCRGFTSDTFITFRLPRIEVGVIGVCCFGDGVKKCKEAMIERLDFYLDKTKLTVTEGAPDKCVYVQKEWTGVSDAGGHLYLAIDMKRAKGLTISHVYTL
jgi:hypothetical protein